MADRIFAGALLLVAIAYTIIAFTIIKAPFQYDPLGPESWPRILGLVAICCSLYILFQPDVSHLGINLPAIIRLAGLILMLLVYAYLFQPLGFVFSTWPFCSALAMMLGAKPGPALLFGAATGIIGYFVCTLLLELNLPAGVLSSIL